jgi:dihydroorotase
MQDTITLGRPDDFHVHLRDGAAMASVVPFAARQFGRALVMPNLKPPVTTVAMAADYRDRILRSVPAETQFSPLMALYLTDGTTVDEVARVANSEFVHAFKYYPAGATTNSDAGVTSLAKVYPVLDAMQRLGVVMCSTTIFSAGKSRAICGSAPSTNNASRSNTSVDGSVTSP